MSVSTVNRIAKKMDFASVLTEQQDKLTDAQKEYRVKFCNAVRLWFSAPLEQEKLLMKSRLF